MALHAPVHHIGVVGTHDYRNLLTAVISLAVLFVLLAIGVNMDVATNPRYGYGNETMPLVQFRAAERADWAAGVATEAQSLIDFRAGERGPSTVVIWTGQPGPR